MLNKQSIELQLLVACCQSEPNLDEISKYLSLMEANSDTVNMETKVGRSTISETLFIQMALQHGILPLVYKTLKFLSSDHEIIFAFKQQYVQIAQRNMLMSAELIRIMKLLEKNGIEALAFKGPVLSQMAYGDITLRQYVDLDVLTHKEDVYRIDALLKTQGYERLLTLTPLQEKTWIKYAHDLGLVHRHKGVHFEMHWSFLDDDYPMQVNLKDFWEDTQEVKLNGHPVTTFSNENLIVYLAIHGSKHLWERIEWIKDIDLIISKNEIVWEKVIKRTYGTGFEKMVYLGLHLNATLFKTTLPESVRDEIAKYSDIKTLQTFIFESWNAPKSTLAKTAVMLKLFPGTKEKLIYLHKIILKPSFNEYWAVDLPKGFYWGYYFVRPYLLLKKYFTKQA